MAIDVKEYVGSTPTFIKLEKKEAKATKKCKAKNNKENNKK